MFVRRKRTKKMTMFRPLELDEDQVAADTRNQAARKCRLRAQPFALKIS
jgi:hypothetical protein